MDKTLAIEVPELQGLWGMLFPDIAIPPDSLWAIWLLRYDETMIRNGIARTALKFQRLNGQTSTEYAGKYASSVMRSIQQEQHEIIK